MTLQDRQPEQLITARCLQILGVVASSETHDWICDLILQLLRDQKTSATTLDVCEKMCNFFVNKLVGIPEAEAKVSYSARLCLTLLEPVGFYSLLLLSTHVC